MQRNEFDDKFLKPTPVMKQQPIKHHQKDYPLAHKALGWAVVLGCFGIVLAFVGALLVLAWRLALG